MRDYRDIARMMSSLTPADFNLIRSSGVNENLVPEARIVVMMTSSGTLAATILIT